MAGGIGSRFWPMSTKSLPKQFLDILNTGKSLIQETYERFAKICPEENILIVTNKDYIPLVKEHIPSIQDKQILGEPIGKNTAPCVCYAAEKIYSINKNATFVVAPSDHVIGNEDKFIKSITKALKYTIKHEKLVTLGIKPTRPDTGYGYIQYNDEVEDFGFNKVKTFTEKPNKELAEHFVNSGEFLWNSGIFVWNASAIINAFEQHLPEVGKLFKDIRADYNTENEQAAIKNSYEMCTNISIDYGILEKANNVFVLPSSFNWSDVGTWNALYDIRQKDENNNVLTGKNIFARNTKNSIIHCNSDRLIALNNVENLIVVDSGKVILIADRNSEQSIKQMVTELKLSKGEQYT